MPWTYETEELSDGMCTTVYDEHGQRIADWLSEERAALIAAAPRLRDALTQLMGRTWQITGKDPATDKVLAYCREVLESTRPE